jgi:SpoVK/Ycf46/Vps4 family AAA+-type ATPase
MTSMIPGSGGGNGQNQMMDLIKFKIISNTDNNASSYGMFYSLIMMMLFEYFSKFVTKFLNKIKKYCTDIWDNTQHDYTLSNFKYKMSVLNSEYLNIIVYLITRDNLLNYKYQTSLTGTKVNDTYQTEDLDSVTKHLFLESVETCIPLKKIKFNEYIYYILAKDVNNKDDPKMYNFLACNTSLADIVNYLKEIKEQHFDKVSARIVYNDNLGSVARYVTSNKKFDNLFFEQKEQIMKILDNFKDDEWYKLRGLAQHLGMLLCGAPGCGKTSFIKAIASYYRKNIYYVDLSKVLTKSAFSKIFNDHINSIIIFEDFDRIPCVLEMMDDGKVPVIDNKFSVTDKECLDKLFEAHIKADTATKESTLLTYKNELNKCTVTVSDKLDQAYILNRLDGIIEDKGRIIIFTANNPERLSKAFVRPGRIDYIVEFKNANHEIIRDMLKHFFQVEFVPSIKAIQEYIYTPAEIIMICKKHNNLKKVINEMEKGKLHIDANRL